MNSVLFLTQMQCLETHVCGSSTCFPSRWGLPQPRHRWGPPRGSAGRGGRMCWENSPAGESSPVPAAKLYQESGKEIAEDVGAAVFSVSVEFCQREEIWQRLCELAYPNFSPQYPCKPRLALPGKGPMPKSSSWALGAADMGFIAAGTCCLACRGCLTAGGVTRRPLLLPLIAQAAAGSEGEGRRQTWLSLRMVLQVLLLG